MQCLRTYRDKGDVHLGSRFQTTAVHYWGKPARVHGDGSLWQGVTHLATCGKQSPVRTRARCNLQEPAHSHQLLTRRLHLRSLALSIQNASLAKEDISYSSHNLPLAPKGSSHLIMKTAFKATWRVPKVLVVSRLFKSPTSFLRFITNS